MRRLAPPLTSLAFDGAASLTDSFLTDSFLLAALPLALDFFVRLAIAILLYRWWSSLRFV